MTAPAFARLILGWKPSPKKNGVPKNKAGWHWVPNVADVDNLESLTLGAAMLTALGQPNPNASTGTVPASQIGRAHV